MEDLDPAELEELLECEEIPPAWYFLFWFILAWLL